MAYDPETAPGNIKTEEDSTTPPYEYGESGSEFPNIPFGD